MLEKQDIIKFSVNHWSTSFHPAEEPFTTWMSDYHYDEYLLNEEYVKKHKLVVVFADIDMSWSFCVTAPREFVEKECPCLLYNEKNKEFLFDPDEEEGLVCCKFKDYTEENIGIWYYNNFEDTFERFIRKENNPYTEGDKEE